jgi:hypothetical protein
MKKDASDLGMKFDGKPPSFIKASSSLQNKVSLAKQDSEDFEIQSKPAPVVPAV